MDKNGNHFIAEFFYQEHLENYIPPEGAIRIAPPPGDNYTLVEGNWVISEDQSSIEEN